MHVVQIDPTGPWPGVGAVRALRPWGGAGPWPGLARTQRPPMPDDLPPPLPGMRRHDAPQAPPAAVAAPLGAGQPAFLLRLDRHLADCRRHGQPLALLSIHIDHLCALDGRPVPGLETSAALELGRRLRERTRAVDTVAWLGAREYGVAMPDCRPEGAMEARRRLAEALAGPYRLGSEHLVMGIGIGCACYPAVAEGGAALLAAAAGERARARAG